MKPKRPQSQPPSRSTSWEPVSKWYNKNVGEDGHYYHQHVVIPGVLRHLALHPKESSLLDIACGSGVLARHIPSSIPYVGLDLSANLIKEAQLQDRNPLHHYIVGDATQPFLVNREFSHATLILALQNIEFPLEVFKHTHKVLKTGGTFVIVLNHPCFRIPRQSSWAIDEAKKLQYRRIDRYGSSMQIPIQAHPSQGEKSAETWSFHHPLSAYSKWLHEAGFSISLVDEWYSNKVSTGGAAKMENRSREEIPLFMALVCKKN